MKGLTNAPLEHGMYELWSNPNPTDNFTAQTITINDFDASKYDAIEIEWAFHSSESYGATPARYPKQAFENSALSVNHFHTAISTSSGLVSMTMRGATITLSGTTLSIVFDTAHLYRVNTYGAAPSDTNDNAREIPVRILGLRHND